jgi:hypothetical protein
MGILSFLKKRSHEPSTFMMEDDYCQIEIIPHSNSPFVSNQAADYEHFAAAHFTGNGFNAVQQRKKNSIQTSQLNIMAKDLEGIFSKYSFPRIKKIQYLESGYINYKEGRTRAYGDTAFSFWTEVLDSKVQNIWITSSIGKNSQRRISQAANVLNILGKVYCLILADWNANEVIDLNKPDDIDAYLEQHY